MKKSTWLLLVLSTTLVFTCKKKDKETQSECEKNPATFASSVKPVIDSKCGISGCHAANSTNGPGPLTNYTQVKSATERIKVAVTNGSMPKNGSLSESEKSSILCWIENGAENN